MSDKNFYALRSENGKFVLDGRGGCVQIYEGWEQAVAMARQTDDVVAVRVMKAERFDRERHQAKRMHDILRDMMNTNEEWGEWVYEMHGEIEELLAELEKGE